MPEDKPVTNKKSSQMDWTEFFRQRPDLEPPGYHETVEKMYAKEQPNED
jgi:hypothetical protein